jgi:hypothetical protein
MLRQSALGQVSMQAACARPYQPQVPGAEFESGVRWRPGFGVREREKERESVCEKERVVVCGRQYSKYAHH